MSFKIDALTRLKKNLFKQCLILYLFLFTYIYYYYFFVNVIHIHTRLLEPDQISHTQVWWLREGLTNRANVHTPM